MKKIFNLCRKKKLKRSGSMKKLFPPIFQEFDINKEKEEQTRKLSFYEKVNSKCLEYKEIQKIYALTGIPPFYLLAIMFTCLFILLINLFTNKLSLSLATVYPLFMTFKALQYYDKYDINSKEEVIHWLKYWIFYSFLLNFESWFSQFLKQFYMFCKFILLLNCFPIKSSLLEWIYTIIFNFFCKYESIIELYASKFYKQLLEENENNDGEDNGNGKNNSNLSGFFRDRLQAGKMAVNFLTKKIN
jgi:hypothetical protein